HPYLTRNLTSHVITQLFVFHRSRDHRALHPFPTRRSSDLPSPHWTMSICAPAGQLTVDSSGMERVMGDELSSTTSFPTSLSASRSEEHTSELQSRENLVCRLLLEKKK